MNATQFLDFAKKNGVELWREGERLRYRAPKELPSKAQELMKSLKPELLPLLEERRADPFESSVAVYRALRGELPVDSVLPLLNDPETDDNLRMWIERVVAGWRADATGRIIPPDAGKENPFAQYSDLIARALAGALAKGKEIRLSETEACEDLNQVVLRTVERIERFQSSRTQMLQHLALKELETLYKAKRAQEALEAEGTG